MLLQAAIDGASKGMSLEDAVEYAKQVHSEVDIIEVGTSFIYRYGMDAVKRIHKEFPDRLILGDMKLVDGGGPSTQMCCEAGADIVTVLGAADDTTIFDAVSAAHLQKKEVMADMICVEKLEKRIQEVERLGVDYICVHIGVDAQKRGKGPLEELRAAKKTARLAKIAVAGGISLSTIDTIVKEKPDVVIVGGGLKTDTPHRTAELIKRHMERNADGNAI